MLQPPLDHARDDQQGRNSDDEHQQSLTAGGRRRRRRARARARGRGCVGNERGCVPSIYSSKVPDVFTTHCVGCQSRLLRSFSE